MNLKQIDKLLDRIMLLLLVPIGITIAILGIIGFSYNIFDLELMLVILIFALMLLFTSGIIDKLIKIEKALK